MRFFTTIFVFTLCAFLAGCTKGNQINGHNLRTANKSVIYIKAHLPTEQRVAFEVSFWSLRDEYRKNSEFLDIVDGKTPEELIVLGKELFQKRKKSGFKGYEKFNSWDDMIAQYTEERMDQSRKKKADPRDKANNVLYDLSQ